MYGIRVYPGNWPVGSTECRVNNGNDVILSSCQANSGPLLRKLRDRDIVTYSTAGYGMRAAFSICC